VNLQITPMNKTLKNVVEMWSKCDNSYPKQHFPQKSREYLYNNNKPLLFLGFEFCENSPQKND
jgi:hypothetical protein